MDGTTKYNNGETNVQVRNCELSKSCPYTKHQEGVAMTTHPERSLTPSQTKDTTLYGGLSLLKMLALHSPHGDQRLARRPSHQMYWSPIRWPWLLPSKQQVTNSMRHQDDTMNLLQHFLLHFSRERAWHKKMIHSLISIPAQTTRGDQPIHEGSQPVTSRKDDHVTFSK